MTDALDELERLLPELGPSLERRRLGESLGHVVDTLRDHDRHVQRLKAILEVAQETDLWAESRQEEALRELMDAAELAADRMLQAATADDLKFVKDVYIEFTKILANTERDIVKPHWARIVERDFKPLVAIGMLLEKIDGVSDLGRRLAECGRSADNSLASMLRVDTLRDEIRRLREERVLLEAERGLLTNEPEVEGFLNALAEGRATLRIVTEKVRDWLEQNGALDNFSIRPL